jgi:hypothetical protein
MGVYKSLADVPARYRLESFAGAYEGRDVWAEYMEYARELNPSDSFERVAGRVERTWKAHMEQRGRHHALAMPSDIEDFLADKLSEAALATAYSPYYVRLEDFYWWLQNHTDHEHRYHPVLMAAAMPDSATAQTYEYKFTYL